MMLGILATLIVGGLALSGASAWIWEEIDFDVSNDIETVIMLVLFVGTMAGLIFAGIGLVELVRYFELLYSMEGGR